jgi:hypothetical protein
MSEVVEVTLLMAGVGILPIGIQLLMYRKSYKKR